MPPEQVSPEQGSRLRVTGRIERLPGGKAVQCIQPAGIEQQPICLVAVSFDDIRLENPMNGETLALSSMPRVPRPSPYLADDILPADIVSLPPLLQRSGGYAVSESLCSTSEEHTPVLPSLMRISYPVSCLKQTSPITH